ncbi:MAG: hypothetical protein ABIN91_15480 [Mucilaginibacter sp.]|uniref:hypothetical protein n=1 Tax=Mucilaginibacter sp. TaxID=1882438 RepID=UPI00326441F5
MKRKFSIPGLLLLFVCMFYINAAVAQNSPKEIFKKLHNELAKDDSTARKVSKTSSNYVDTAFQKKYQQYSFGHLMRVFDWQYRSSIIIFFIVIIIVLMGLILSYKQFTLHEKIVTESIKLKQVSTEIIKQDPAAQISSFEVGKDGLKINTAVIGLMILVISVVFLFLYLKYVYPIQFADPMG